MNISQYPICNVVDLSDPITVLNRYVVPVLFGIVDIIGFSGNLLVIIVIAGYASMRNSTNILIVSLALADLSFIIFCVPFTAIFYVTGYWPLPGVICTTYIFATYFSVYCSVYTLVLMCLDRFLAVVYPLRSRLWRTTKNTVIAVIIMWIIIIVATLPIMIESQLLYTIESVNDTVCQMPFCHTKWLFDSTPESVVNGVNAYNGRIFYGVFFVFGYAFPLTMICIFYSILLKELLCGRVSKMSKSVEAHRGKRKATKMVIVVVIVFAACWLPIQVVFMIQNFYQDIPTVAFRLFHVLGNILAYGNSCVNPILYAFFSENFRMGFASLICLDKTKMRTVRCGSTAGQSEILITEAHLSNFNLKTFTDNAQQEEEEEEEEELENDSSQPQERKELSKEVSFVESVCVHPHAPAPQNTNMNLSE